jgi:hypothetical protein
MAYLPNDLADGDCVYWVNPKELMLSPGMRAQNYFGDEFTVFSVEGDEVELRPRRGDHFVVPRQYFDCHYLIVVPEDDE